jgi:hypothetical protein
MESEWQTGIHFSYTDSVGVNLLASGLKRCYHHAESQPFPGCSRGVSDVL